VNDGLVSSGLIDSLAIVQIVVYLESTYGIDFAAGGFDPERLATITSILDLIEETRT
jgi:acyl carrier protein